MNSSYLMELRYALNLTQVELAEASNLSERTIRRWEKEGIPKNTHFHHVCNYASALKCPIDVILHFSRQQKINLEIERVQRVLKEKKSSRFADHRTTAQ